MSGPPQPPTSEGIVTRPSPHSVAETLDRLRAAIAARGLTLFAEIDHGGEAARVGLAMQPAHVLVFGNPRAGTPLMVASPLVALDLPLKVLVWEDAEAHAWVSYARPADLARRYGIPPDLLPNIAGVEGLVEGALAG
jgi:uncharacterized protein (DUF302 family)